MQHILRLSYNCGKGRNLQSVQYVVLTMTMNISLENYYNPSVWNVRLMGVSTYITEEPSKPVFSFGNLFDSFIEHFVVRKLIHQVRAETEKVNNIVNTPIKANLSQASKEEAAKIHKDLLGLLDKLSMVEKLKIGSNENKLALELHRSTIDFLEALKKLEQKTRVEVWPEENKILLTYDELKELYNSQEFCN